MNKILHTERSPASPYLGLLTESDIRPDKQSTFQNRQGLSHAAPSEKANTETQNTYRQLPKTLTPYIYTNVLHPGQHTPGCWLVGCTRDTHACCLDHVSKVTKVVADCQFLLLLLPGNDRQGGWVDA